MLVLHKLRIYIINLRSLIEINKINVGIHHGHAYENHIYYRTFTQCSYNDLYIKHSTKKRIIPSHGYDYAEMDYFVESTRYTSISYNLYNKEITEIAYVNYKKIVIYDLKDNTVVSITTILFPKHIDETSQYYNIITKINLNHKYLEYEYIYNYQRRPGYDNPSSIDWNIVHRVNYNKHTKLPVYSEYVNKGYYQQKNPKCILKCYYDKLGQAKKYRSVNLGTIIKN